MTDLPEVSARGEVVRILPLSVLITAIQRGMAEHYGKAPTRVVASPVQVTLWTEHAMQWASKHEVKLLPLKYLKIMNIPVVPGLKDALPELQWVKTVEG